MTQTWNDVRQEEVVNAVFANFAIPMEVARPVPKAQPTWRVHVFGGTLDASLKRMRSRQDRILRRYVGRGVRGVTRQEGLFMYATQWFEWVVFRGCEDDAPLLDLMEGWFAMYAGLGERFAN